MHSMVRLTSCTAMVRLADVKPVETLQTVLTELQDRCKPFVHPQQTELLTENSVCLKTRFQENSADDCGSGDWTVVPTADPLQLRFVRVPAIKRGRKQKNPAHLRKICFVRKGRKKHIGPKGRKKHIIGPKRLSPDPKMDALRRLFKKFHVRRRKQLVPMRLR